MSQEETTEPPKIIKEAHTRCNFCGKDVSEVFTLITGPGVNICDGCVIEGLAIITKEINRREAKLEKIVPFEQSGEEQND